MDADQSFMLLSNEDEAIRVAEGENVTWFIGLEWPVRRAWGFMEVLLRVVEDDIEVFVVGIDQRNMVKSSLAETSRSVMVPLMRAADSYRWRAFALFASSVGGMMPVWS